jgi:hypothetical protein
MKPTGMKEKTSHRQHTTLDFCLSQPRAAARRQLQPRTTTCRQLQPRAAAASLPSIRSDLAATVRDVLFTGGCFDQIRCFEREKKLKGGWTDLGNVVVGLNYYYLGFCRGTRVINVLEVQKS